MTEPEHQLLEADEILREETCICGAVPVLTYEPGVMAIECPRCQTQAVTPEFNTSAVLAEWRRKTNPD